MNLKIAQNFLQIREFGGNCELLAERQAWIDIWLERKDGELLTNNPHQSLKAPRRLQEVFREKAEAGIEWARFIKINVKNSTLLKSPCFRQAMEKLQSQAPVFGGLGV